MGIKKFKVFNEDLDENKYKDVKEELTSMISKSLGTSDYKTNGDFISAILRNPDESKIEGLINDSDIYEFYLKYRNDIDECLSDIKYYNEIPSENNIFGLYDYIVKGTNRAVKELITSLK